jgi:hypothetical protein
MSVHNESLEISKSADRMEAAPELEYRAVSHDSLSMFLAAIGGAILGMLLTLLILALINGGTLSFTGGERLTTFEGTLTRVNENVGAVSANVDLVSQQAQAVADQLGALEASMNGELSTLSGAVTQLDQTRQQFDLFMGALSDAMAQMSEIQAGNTDEAPSTETTDAAVAQPEAAAETTDAAVAQTEASTEEADAATDAAVAVAEPAAAESALPALTAANSAEVAAGALSVVFFVDANANGTLDEGETPVEDATVTVTDSAGSVVAGEGLLFSDLNAGDYSVTVQETPGFTLLTTPDVTVQVTEGATEGQVIYVPLAAE